MSDLTLFNPQWRLMAEYANKLGKGDDPWHCNVIIGKRRVFATVYARSRVEAERRARIIAKALNDIGGIHARDNEDE